MADSGPHLFEFRPNSGHHCSISGQFRPTPDQICLNLAEQGQRCIATALWAERPHATSGCPTMGRRPCLGASRPTGQTQPRAPAPPTSPAPHVWTLVAAVGSGRSVDREGATQGNLSHISQVGQPAGKAVSGWVGRSGGLGLVGSVGSGRVGARQVRKSMPQRHRNTQYAVGSAQYAMRNTPRRGTMTDDDRQRVTTHDRRRRQRTTRDQSRGHENGRRRKTDDGDERRRPSCAPTGAATRARSGRRLLPAARGEQLPRDGPGFLASLRGRRGGAAQALRERGGEAPPRELVLARARTPDGRQRPSCAFPEVLCKRYASDAVIALCDTPGRPSTPKPSEPDAA